MAFPQNNSLKKMMVVVRVVGANAYVLQGRESVQFSHPALKAFHLSISSKRFLFVKLGAKYCEEGTSPPYVTKLVVVAQDGTSHGAPQHLHREWD